MPTQYNWTFGEIEARDVHGLTGVATHIHNIYCEATATDGTTVKVGPLTCTLGKPDPSNFEVIKQRGNSPDAAMTQRKKWVGAAKIKEWKSQIDSVIAAVQKAETENARVVE